MTKLTVEEFLQFLKSSGLIIAICSRLCTCGDKFICYQKNDKDDGGMCHVEETASGV